MLFIIRILSGRDFGIYFAYNHFWKIAHTKIEIFSKEHGSMMSVTMTQLNEIFQDVFEDDELEVSRETTAHDVEGWDSLMHVTLIVNVEKAFGVKFSSSEISALKKVGDLEDLIHDYQNG